MLDDMEPHLIQAEAVEIVAPDAGETVDDEGWSPLPPPTNEDAPVSEVVATSDTSTHMDSLEDERAQLEAELARLDAERSHRIAHTPAPVSSGADTALADLESRLSDIEF